MRSDIYSRIVKRLTSIMLYEYRKSTNLIPLEKIATLISECDRLYLDFARSLQVLKRMVDEGSRFANLERVLGHSIVFLLCYDGSNAL